MVVYECCICCKVVVTIFHLAVVRRARGRLPKLESEFDYVIQYRQPCTSHNSSYNRHSRSLTWTYLELTDWGPAADMQGKKVEKWVGL
jgi:hypothetical protein